MMGPTMPTEESMSDLEDMDGSLPGADEEAEVEVEDATDEEEEEPPELVSLAETEVVKAIQANQKKRMTDSRGKSTQCALLSSIQVAN